MCAARLPVPTPVFTKGIESGYNTGLYNTGPKPKVVNAECIEQLKDCLRAMRESAVSVNIAALRALLIGIFVKNDQQHLLSPHLLNPGAPANPRLFCCSDYWMRCFMYNVMGWSYRCGTRAGQKVPDNWQELVEEALSRIAAAAVAHNIPRCRTFMADETFMFYHPEQKCDPLLDFHDFLLARCS
jgi:hypothetical protein